MKTLKHNTQSIIAIVTEKTVYLANLKGKIYKQFGVSTFNDSAWTEIEGFSDEEYAIAIADFLNVESGKKAEKQRREEQSRVVAYEKRKQEIINLWNWRKGRTEAFLVATSVELNDNSSSNPESYSSELVFGEDAAHELFDSIKESETPSWDCKSNNCYFVTEILKFYKEPTNKLEITSIEELEQALRENSDIEERNEYAPSIEEYDYIITFDKWDGFHNKTYRGRIQNIEERRTWTGWIGSSKYSPQATSADLGWNQEAVTLDQLKSDYYDEAVRFGIINEPEETED